MGSEAQARGIAANTSLQGGCNMTQGSPESSRQAIIERLNRVRDDYELCLLDVSAEVGMRGTEWSMVDLLHHSTGDFARNRVKRILEEDNPDLGALDGDMEEDWRRVKDSTLADIDLTISEVSELNADQLQRSGRQGDEIATPLSLYEMWAGHYEEHLAQLRNEIRPREGLPSV